MQSTQLDPHVPVLYQALKTLQIDVRHKRMTPAAANATLGKLADSLIAADRNKAVQAAMRTTLRRSPRRH